MAFEKVKILLRREGAESCSAGPDARHSSGVSCCGRETAGLLWEAQPQMVIFVLTAILCILEMYVHFSGTLGSERSIET
jgi:hypothetical protein